MNSLFVKILLWFWATLVITTIGSALILGLSGPRPYLLSRLVAFELKEARAAYESGGRQGLERFKERFQSVFSSEGVLTDAAGRDLLTGADESALLAKTREKSRFPPIRRGGAVIGRPSDDGKYWFFFVIPRERLLSWFLLPEHWWGMAAGIFLCYLLAFYLTQPVRRLQRAVESFGHGDLSARASSPRRDELGDLARTFDRMADRIQTLVDAERRLLLDISHELRSPLARLRVAVELARSGEDREGAINRIEKEAERLNGLVTGLLQVTRAEGDPGALRREPVRLDHLLGEIVADSSLEARARGCDVRLTEAQPAVVQGDESLSRIRSVDQRSVGCLHRSEVGRVPPPLRHMRAGQPAGQQREVISPKRSQSECHVRREPGGEGARLKTTPECASAQGELSGLDRRG